MAKERQLDIFALLKEVDRKNFKFYDQLTEDQIKEFSPLVTHRWMTGTSSERQLIFLNEFVNPYLYSLGNHKGLLYRLMCIASDGVARRYSWNKFVGTGEKAKKLAVEVVMEYYGYSTRRATEALILLPVVDILELATDLGWQDDKIKELKKELK